MVIVPKLLVFIILSYNFTYSKITRYSNSIDFINELKRGYLCEKFPRMVRKS